MVKHKRTNTKTISQTNSKKTSKQVEKPTPNHDTVARVLTFISDDIPLKESILGAIDNQGEFKAAPAAPEIPNSPAGASLPRRTIGDSGDGVVGMIPFADLPSTKKSFLIPFGSSL